MKKKRTGYVASLMAGSAVILATTAGLALAEAPTTDKPGSPGIRNGSIVKLEYRLSDDKGTVLDTNEGQELLVYTHGEGQIIPGLEKVLGGLHVGDTKHVVVPLDEAYGPVRPEAFIEVPKERIPEKFHTVGAHLVAQGDNGQTRHAFVKEVKEKTILLDTNHPLAGKALTFDVKVIEVEAAQEKK